MTTGVGSAREIARLVSSDDAYRWIVGGLEVGHDALSSFRVEHDAALDELMTDILGSLMHKAVLSLDLVAQDGIRIRAAATAPSFRRLPSLLQCREQAALQLKAVLAQADTRNSRARSTWRAWRRRLISRAASRRRSLRSTSCSTAACRRTSQRAPRPRTPKRV